MAKSSTSRAATKSIWPARASSNQKRPARTMSLPGLLSRTGCSPCSSDLLVLSEHFPHLFGRQWPTEQEALYLVTAAGAQKFRLLPGFHTFRDHPQPQVLRQRHDRLGDRRIIGG